MFNLLPAEIQHDRIQCRPCGKWSYRNRKAARKAMRNWHRAEPRVNVYRCPVDRDYWHVGHRRVAAAKGTGAHT